MKSASNQHGLLRKRDFCVLCIIAITIYLSLKTINVTYKLEPAFYIDQRIGKKSSSSNSNNDWQFVAPIVTDLDGDGSNELVYITKDLHLKVIIIIIIIIIILKLIMLYNHIIFSLFRLFLLYYKTKMKYIHL
jgi:hypothetical protein